MEIKANLNSRDKKYGEQHLRGGDGRCGELCGDQKVQTPLLAGTAPY